MLTLLLACNGPDADVVPPVDADGDGFVVGDDCDDGDASVHIGAREVPGDGRDQDCDGVDPLAERTLSGAEPNEGFGSRVVIAGADVVVSAPFAAPAGTRAAGRVERAGVSVAGTDEAFFGAGLAVLGDGTVLVGAPGQGRVTTLDGEVRLTSPGVGGVLAARGDAWVASSTLGVVDAAGAATTWDQRPDALALDAAGGVWAGFARGDLAIRVVGGATVARGTRGDEAGYALLFADLDGDGAEELVVGAPGSGVVYVLDPADLPASLADVSPIGPGAGRFGAALAAGAEGRLYVGAPMAGGGAEGAVHLVREGVVTEWRTGETPGDQLGAALAYARQSLVIGAPGAADTPGSARVVVP